VTSPHRRDWHPHGRIVATGETVVSMVLGEHSHRFGIGLCIGIPLALLLRRALALSSMESAASEPIVLGGAVLVSVYFALVAGFRFLRHGLPPRLHHGSLATRIGTPADQRIFPGLSCICLRMAWTLGNLAGANYELWARSAWADGEVYRRPAHPSSDRMEAMNFLRAAPAPAAAHE